MFSTEKNGSHIFRIVLVSGIPYAWRSETIS